MGKLSMINHNVFIINNALLKATCYCLTQTLRVSINTWYSIIILGAGVWWTVSLTSVLTSFIGVNIKLPQPYIGNAVWKMNGWKYFKLTWQHILHKLNQTNVNFSNHLANAQGNRNNPHNNIPYASAAWSHFWNTCVYSAQCVYTLNRTFNPKERRNNLLTIAIASACQMLFLLVSNLHFSKGIL